MAIKKDDSPVGGYNVTTYGGKDLNHEMAITHHEYLCLPGIHSDSWLHDEQ